MSVAKSFSLTGDIFVRLPLMSRIAQRRRISVYISSPASNDFACFADLTARRASVGGSTMAGSTPGSSLCRLSEKDWGAGSLSNKEGGAEVSPNIAVRVLRTVSMPSSASNDFACSAVTALSVSLGERATEVSTAGSSRGLESVWGAGSSSKNVGGDEGLLN